MVRGSTALFTDALYANGDVWIGRSPIRRSCTKQLNRTFHTEHCSGHNWLLREGGSGRKAGHANQTNPALTAARFLLKPGRKYEEAVKTFEPYDRVKEPNDDARAAGAKLIAEGRAAKKKQTYKMKAHLRKLVCLGVPGKRLTVPIIADSIRIHFGVSYHKTHIARLMRKHGYVYLIGAGWKKAAKKDERMVSKRRTAMRV